VTKEVFATFLIVTWLIIFLTALIYYQYYAWFRPEKFKSDQVGNVKNWWPFQNFFRSWFSSSTYLWFVRIVSGIALAVTLIMISLAILGFSEIIP